MTGLAEINRDVWLPFLEAYATCRVELLSEVLAPDFVRVERSVRWIGDRHQHLTRTNAGFDKANERGDALAIDVRFVDRVVEGGLAHEGGYYRVTITGPEGSEQRFHGRFDSVLRHTSEGWRMILDQDDDAAATDFEGARLLDDIDAFAVAASDASRAGA